MMDDNNANDNGHEKNWWSIDWVEVLHLIMHANNYMRCPCKGRVTDCLWLLLDPMTNSWHASCRIWIFPCSFHILHYWYGVNCEMNNKMSVHGLLFHHRWACLEADCLHDLGAILWLLSIYVWLPNLAIFVPKTHQKYFWITQIWHVQWNCYSCTLHVKLSGRVTDFSQLVHHTLGVREQGFNSREGTRTKYWVVFSVNNTHPRMVSGRGISMFSLQYEREN